MSDLNPSGSSDSSGQSTPAIGLSDQTSDLLVRLTTLLGSLRSSGATTRSQTRYQNVLSKLKKKLQISSDSEIDIFSSEEELEAVRSIMAGDNANGNNGNAAPDVHAGTSTYRTVVTWISQFNGNEEKYMDFIRECDQAFKHIKLEEYKDLTAFVMLMISRAGIGFGGGDDGYDTWEKIRSALYEHFGRRVTENSLFKEITNMKKRPGETTFAFYNRLCQQIVDLEKYLKEQSSLTPDQVEGKMVTARSLVKDLFINVIGTNHRGLVCATKPRNIKEAFLALRDIEINTGITNANSVEERVNEMMEIVRNFSLAPPPPVLPAPVPVPPHVVDTVSRFANPEVGRNEPPQPAPVRCQLCKRTGHEADRCFFFKVEQKGKGPNGNNNGDDSGNGNGNGSGNGNRNNYRNNNNRNFGNSSRDHYNNNNGNYNNYGNNNINGHQRDVNSFGNSFGNSFRNNNGNSNGLSFGRNFNNNNNNYSDPSTSRNYNQFRGNPAAYHAAGYPAEHFDYPPIDQQHHHNNPHGMNGQHFCPRNEIPNNNNNNHHQSSGRNDPPTRALCAPGGSGQCSKPNVRNVYTEEEASGRNIFIYLELNGIVYRSLLDTGSQLNLIKRSIAEGHEKYVDPGMVIKGINGRSMTNGSLFLNFTLGNHEIKDLFHIVEDESLGRFDFYIGSKFFLINRVITDYDNFRMYNKFFNIPINVEHILFDIQSALVVNVDKLVSVCHNVYADKREKETPDVDVNNAIRVRVLEIDELEVNQIDISKFKLSHLSGEILNRMKAVLVSFSRVFEEMTANNLPNLTFDSLDLVSDKYIQTKIYRFPPSFDSLVREEMNRLLELNVISHSKSPFNSPVWIVPKKDSENGEKNYRIVIDYRRLNEITIQDNYPLPNIADIIDQLGNAKYFTVMDLTSSFHQIALRPCDRYKTAFTVLGSHYEFNRMPFGLINSAAAFQRIMSQVLDGLIGIYCFVYIDDIVVYGDTIDTHFRNLSIVLERLRVNKLKVKPSKCHFLEAEICYLGFVISRDGVKMDKKKVEAITSFKEPENEKQLKSFLGLAGFYRKFMPNFSFIAQPLHNLLKKSVVFEWDDDCKNAFKKLIEVISKDIVLKYPDFTKTFYLTTDASNFGIGAVISQKDSVGRDRPIAFISRSLNSAERNYSTTEKECLAIVWSVNEFRHYLTGRKFVILSDHRPLQWLNNVTDPGARLLRWRLKLNNYDYSITYTPGKTNYVADELSRNGFCNFIEDNSIFNEALIPSIKALNINDPIIDPDASDDDDGLNDDDDDVVDDDEEEVESFDFHPRADREKITDEVIVTELIKEQHSGPIGGHRGINATYNAVNIYFIIKGLRKKVINIVRACDTCQRAKYNRQHRALPLIVTTTASFPNEKIAFDVVGPFKFPNGTHFYGLTIQDEFSKLIRFCGIRNCTAEVIAKAFIEEWILNYGLPKYLVSDNGANLCGTVMTFVANYFNISRITTAIAHPQSNASVERAHGRLAEFIRATDKELEESLDWESKLRLASFCYNNTVHATTGFSPYYIMFGRHPRPITSHGRMLDTLPDSYLSNFRDTMNSIWERARNNIITSKELSIERENKKVIRRKVEDFKVGDKVMVESEVFKGKANRTQLVWTGPFEISEVLDHGIRIRKRNRIGPLINKGRVRPYVEPLN